MIVWIAQTPFQIPIFWTNERLENNVINVVGKWYATQFCAICCCCAGYCIANDNLHFGQWIAMMYRFIVSLIFSSMMVHITSSNYNGNHANGAQLQAWCIILLLLTIILSLAFSLVNGLVFKHYSNSDRQNLTLDRNATNLASSGGWNELDDLNLFGMEIDNIINVSVGGGTTGDDPPVLVAAELGDDDGLRALVNHGVDFNVMNKKRETPLTASCANGHIECMTILIENTKNFNINARHKKGSTLLILAAANNRLKMASYLMDTFSFTIDINAAEKNGYTALSHFIHHKNMEGVKMLLSDERIKISTNVVFFAAENGGIDVLKILINRDVDFSVTDDEGDTPLIAAIRHRQREAIVFLLSQGKQPPDPICDINQGNSKTGATPLMISATMNNNERSTNKDIGILKMLVEKFNANVNLGNKKGRSALHYAVTHNNVDAIELLLDYGIDINMTNKRGDTVIMETCENEQVECLAILIEKSKDFDVNATYKNGQTLLILGAFYNRLKSVRYLLNTFSQTIDINIKDDDEWTALMYASFYGSIDVIEYLLSNFKNKIDLNAQDNVGRTALSLAMVMGHVGCITLLRSNGAT